MSVTTLSRKQKAFALVPLALASGLWTASIAGSTSGALAAADRTGQGRLPTVPSDAIEAPASVPSAGVIAPGVPAGTSDTVVDSANVTGIPSAALSAYQRAAQIIGAADKSCHLPWELIAAIGRVESDHGRYGGNVLSSEGVSRPGIYGIPLNGKNGTQAIQDTDGGQLDQDTVYDRAVGAMQFIPGTWNVVKVDADGDGQRNPQDIDDSSLATAVYLCSGEEDLGTDAGRRKAVFRYNHSQQYVDLVLRIMQAYQSGDYSAVPNSSYGGAVYSPSSSSRMKQARTKAIKRIKIRNERQNNSGGSSGGSGTTGGSTVGGATGGTTSGGTTSGGSVVGGVTEKVDKAVGGVTGGGSGGGSGSGSGGGGGGGGGGAVADTVTRAEALARCTAQGVVDNPLTAANELEACIRRVMG